MPYEPLDPQRHRLYGGEDKAFPDEIVECSLAELQLEADEITGASWFQKRYKVRRIMVKDGRGGRTARAGGDGKSIHLKHGARLRYYVVHEIAHVVDTSGGEDHGSVFAGLYLFMVGQVYGPNTKRRLAAEFRKCEPPVVWDRRVATTGRP